MLTLYVAHSLVSTVTLPFWPPFRREGFLSLTHLFQLILHVGQLLGVHVDIAHHCRPHPTTAHRLPSTAHRTLMNTIIQGRRCPTEFSTTTTTTKNTPQHGMFGQCHLSLSLTNFSQSSHKLFNPKITNFQDQLFWKSVTQIWKITPLFNLNYHNYSPTLIAPLFNINYCNSPTWPCTPFTSQFRCQTTAIFRTVIYT